MNPSDLSGSSPLVSAFLFLGILFLVFMLGRALVLWYWKVNQIVKLLQSIDSKLSGRSAAERLDQHLAGQGGSR